MFLINYVLLLFFSPQCFIDEHVEISHDAAMSVKNSAINAVNGVKNISKSVYKNAKEMNMQKVIFIVEFNIH